MAREAKEIKDSKDSREERIKALDAAVLQIEKQYGKGSIMRLGDPANKMNVDTVPTGSLSLDLALGLGGLPKGRIVEVYGPESSGKTTIALHVVAEVQKAGGIAAFVDAEHALDPSYARKIGVQIDDLYISQPDNGEQALEITETMVRSGAVDVVIVDSVAALVPKAEIDGDMGDSHVGLQARLMSQGLRKLIGVISRTDCIVIFINQLREKIGIMFGNPETTTGGRALKFYSSVRLDVRKIEAIKQGGIIIGNRTRIKVVKNKIAPPFKEAEFDIMFGEGISREGDILDIASNIGIVNKSGAWYSYEGDKIGQGRENAKQFLKENPQTCAEIDQKVRAHYEALRMEEKEREEKEISAKLAADPAYQKQGSQALAAGKPISSAETASGNNGQSPAEAGMGKNRQSPVEAGMRKNGQSPAEADMGKNGQSAVNDGSGKNRQPSMDTADAKGTSAAKPDAAGQEL